MQDTQLWALPTRLVVALLGMTVLPGGLLEPPQCSGLTLFKIAK